MKKVLLLFTVFALSGGFAFTQNIPKWEIKNPDRAVSFQIGSLLGKVDGTIGGLKGDIYFAPDDPAGSSFDVSLDVKTLSTDNNKRDKHLMEHDYFHEDQFPKIYYTAKGLKEVTLRGKTGYVANGDLTLHGIKHPVKLAFSFEPGEEGLGVFEGTMTINRLNYGVGESTMKIKDMVEISIVVVGKKR